MHAIGSTGVQGGRWNQRDVEELLLGAIENISEGFALYDSEDRLVLFNDNYRFFKSSDIDTVRIGASFSDIVRSATAAGYYPVAHGREAAWIDERTAYHNNPSGVFEVELKDGRWLQIVERRTPSGGTVTVNTDVTSKRHRDEALQQASRLQSLGQLTSGIAHDFGTALMILEANLALIEQQVGQRPDTEVYFQSSRSIVGVARSLIEQLLGFAGQKPLRMTITDANPLVKRVTEMLRHILPSSITIETRLSADVCSILADPHQLEGTLINLALNARDAMPKGGVLVFGTENVMRGPEWAQRRSDMRSGSYVILTVADTGIGMSADILVRALDPFFTTKGPGKGCGLGLSTSYGFVRQSGGDLELISAPGAGTTVVLSLPRIAAGFHDGA